MQPHRRKEVAVTTARRAARLLFGLAVLAGLLLGSVFAMAAGYALAKGVSGIVDWAKQPAVVANKGGTSSTQADRKLTNPGGDAAAQSGHVQSHASAEGAPPTEIPMRLPPFYDWPEEKPALLIAVTGEAHGHLRPCGCSADQVGGFARRKGVEKLVEAKGWPKPVFVDLGDIISMSGALETIRYEYALKSLDTLGYAYVAIGPDDLSIGINSIVGQVINLKDTKAGQASLFSPEPNFQADIDAFAVKVHTVDAGGFKVGIGSAIGDALAGAVKDATVKVRPQAETLAEIDKLMTEAKATYRVLLAHVDVASAKELAKAHPHYDLIVCRSAVEDSTRREATQVGKTTIAWVGHKSKAVGVVGVYAKGAENPRETRFELVTLDKTLEHSQEVDDVYARFVDTIKRDDLAGKWRRMPHPSGAAFLGSQACGKCHVNAYTIWKGSKHGHAMESLAKATKEQPAGQDYNPECIKCHSTGFNQVDLQNEKVGFGYHTGFVTPDKTPHLAGNGCENCHGPGSKHAADPYNESYLSPLRRNRLTVADRCQKCHDADNSIKWNFETYWPKVAHPGKQDARDLAPKKS